MSKYKMIYNLLIFLIFVSIYSSILQGCQISLSNSFVYEILISLSPPMYNSNLSFKYRKPTILTKLLVGTIAAFSFAVSSVHARDSSELLFYTAADIPKEYFKDKRSVRFQYLITWRFLITLNFLCTIDRRSCCEDN